MRRASDHGSAPRLVVVGDALLDRTWEGDADRLCPDAVGPVVDLRRESSSPGGAALTAMAAAALGAEVVFVTAIGDDDAGDLVRVALAHAGVRVVDVGLLGPTPEKIRVRCAAGTVTRLDRGCVPVANVGDVRDAQAAGVRRRLHDALASADAVLLSDYGRGLVRAVVGAARDLWPDDALPLATPEDGTAPVPVVWDPHPASDRPSTAITLATPNLREARAAVGATASTDAEEVALRVAAHWRCDVAVTCGADGAAVATWRGAPQDGAVQLVPTTPADGDACGAGDWFAAGTSVALAGRTSTVAAVAAGCRSAADWVRSGPVLLRTATGATHEPGARRRTVVATSGCFDVLHVGHLSMLRHARSLGDRLVVLVNSDESVRRLKGHGRPVNGEDDRVALLAGLSCVDEVRVFDELTPCEALADLRPDVFVKGADYAGRHLPEEDVLREWGGRVVLAPLVSGRSTTRVLRLAGELSQRVG